MLRSDWVVAIRPHPKWFDTVIYWPRINELIAKSYEANHGPGTQPKKKGKK